MSINVASICLFKEFDLDFMIAAWCAPTHRYMHPAERIISILNLGLQNVTKERAPGDDESIGEKCKKSNSIAELREIDGKVSRVKRAWLNSVDEVKSAIWERLSWLSLKEVPFTEVTCVSNKEIEHFQRHSSQLFPEISMVKLQKTHVPEIQSCV